MYNTENLIPIAKAYEEYKIQRTTLLWMLAIQNIFMVGFVVGFIALLEWICPR